MNVTFEFCGYLVEIIGKEMVSVSFEGMGVTLAEALKQMSSSFLDIHERLEQSGILSDGELKAMFVMDNNLIQLENEIPDNCVIRVLPLICGG